ncbi:ACT domain-containing protein [Streptomyces sp. NPDC001657]|uniref:ACT domain-containing protein n=1 Tax=Streptomyces sp. NPDC001657 TaxID=3154522 RepID=UPI00332D9C51
MTAHLQDLESLEVHLPDRPGALADLAQALGRAGVSLDGGGGRPGCHHDPAAPGDAWTMDNSAHWQDGWVTQASTYR